MIPPRISQICIYPVKSCAGISLEEAEIQARGLRNDRRFMVPGGLRRGHVDGFSDRETHLPAWRSMRALRDYDYRSDQFAAQPRTAANTSRYRSSTEGGVIFGMNFCCEQSSGLLRVGQPVTVNHEPESLAKS